MTFDEYKEKVFHEKPEVKEMYDAIHYADEIFAMIAKSVKDLSIAEREILTDNVGKRNMKVLDPNTDERSDAINSLASVIIMLNACGYQLNIERIPSDE